MRSFGVKFFLGSKKILIPLLVVLFVVLLSGGILLYSGSPSFCNLCHFMKPYYEAWKSSKHNQVACVQCHIPPQPKEALRARFQVISLTAQYVMKGNGSRPHAEIADESCLREGCHETRLLKGEVSFKRDIIFNHLPHLKKLRGERKLRCTSCHSQIVVGSHMQVTDSTCYLCHFKVSDGSKGLSNIGGCPLCHQSPRERIELDGVAFSHKEFVQSRNVACEKCHRDSVQGTGEASQDRCLNCHNKPRMVAKYGDKKFMHQIHVEDHNVDCLHCHHEIKHKKVSVNIRHQVRRCEICHLDMHSLTESMMRGEKGRGAPPIPSHMFLARLDCASCHSFRKEIRSTPGGGQTLVTSEKICAHCHSERWTGMLLDWKETLKRMLDDIEPKLRIAGSRVRGLQDDHSKVNEVRALLDDAAFNVDYVERARGIHNPFYAARLIAVANSNLDKIFEKLGEKTPELPKGSPVRGTYCARLCHHKAGVETPDQVMVYGKQFSHRRHAFDHKMGCTKCHSSERHKEVSITKQDCLGCHSRDEKPLFPSSSLTPLTIRAS
jgi:hypothetical protein